MKTRIATPETNQITSISQYKNNAEAAKIENHHNHMSARLYQNGENNYCSAEITTFRNKKVSDIKITSRTMIIKGTKHRTFHIDIPGETMRMIDLTFYED